MAPPDALRLRFARQQFISTLDGLWALVADGVLLLDSLEGHDPVLSTLSTLPKEVAETVVSEMRTVAEAVLTASTHSENHGEEIIGETIVGGDISPLASILLMRSFRASVRSKSGDLVRRATLPVAVGAFEVMLGEIALATFTNYPGLLGDEEKRFSLADLRRLDSFDEATAEIIERRSDALLGGGLSEWLTWLRKEPLNIHLEQLTPAWNETVEVFQRRHLIVHSNGRVTKRYRSALEGLVDDIPPEGTEVVCDAEYVLGAIDRILLLGDVLFAFTARRLYPGIVVTGDILENIFYLLSNKRWFAAHGIAGIAASFRDQSEISRKWFLLARDLAQKKLGGVQSIKGSPAELDTSALGHELRAAYFAIMDQDDSAIQSLRRAIYAGDTTLHTLQLSPFFSDLDLSSLVGSGTSGG